MILTKTIEAIFESIKPYLMGLTNLTPLDDPIKCTRPPWHDTDEHRRAINKSLQCFGQLPNNWQTVGASLKSIFMSLKALQKGH